jgi:hypothetical protein
VIIVLAVRTEKEEALIAGKNKIMSRHKNNSKKLSFSVTFERSSRLESRTMIEQMLILKLLK